MRVVLVLVGVRGSGKSTLARTLRDHPFIDVFRPSTTRVRRETETDEYYYIDGAEWHHEQLAWDIAIGDVHYGVRVSAIDELPCGHAGLVVFSPSHIHTLDEYAKRNHCQCVTIGIDTIDTAAAQADRVNREISRVMDPILFATERDVVRNCDVVLRGSVDTLIEAVEQIAVLRLSGGVLHSKAIQSLLAAGTLLTNAIGRNVQPATYDLRLAETFWCKGRWITLDDKQPEAIVPPYSYILAQAIEQADLPRFIVGRYDLKLSLFFEGLTLSNGPQVDPGYRGGLMCLLFNGSDRNVALRLGNHFATIEFCTTAWVTDGYRGAHQNCDTVLDFLTPGTAIGPGGSLADRFLELENSWRDAKGTIIGVGLTLLAIIIAAGFAVNAWIGSTRTEMVSDVRDQQETVADMIKENRALGESVRTGLDAMRDRDTLPVVQEVAPDGGRARAAKLGTDVK